jgi:xylan 1,4-beta-xylosidase
VELSLSGLGARETALTHYRVDETHSNAYATWRRMGSPIAPTRAQYTELEAAGKLATLEPPTTLRGDGGALAVRFSLPRQAVSLVVFEAAR